MVGRLLLELLGPCLPPITLVPLALLDDLPFNYLASAVLETLEPATNVDTPVFPAVLTLAVELVVLKLAKVELAVGPGEFACSIQLILLPLAFIYFAVGPAVLATSVDNAIFEFSLVGGAICQRQQAHTILFVV